MTTSHQTRHAISYDSAGIAGSPVLLIMGFTMRGDAWRYQIDRFAAQHRVAWFDHAGVGASGPLVTRRLSMRHLALDALGVMDDLGWPHAHIVGISMGGMIAQHVALRAPHRVSSLTLAATHPGGPRFVVPPLEGIRNFVGSYRGGRSDRIDALSRLLFSDSFRDGHPDRVREILRADFHRPPPLSVGLGQIGAIAGHDTRSRLSELDVHRTLIVRPGEDVLVDPRGSDVLADGIRTAEVVRFDDAGHAVSRQCADRFNDTVLQHIASAELGLRA